MRAGNKDLYAKIRLNRTITQHRILQKDCHWYRGIFRASVKVNIHHWFCHPAVERWRCVVWDMRREREVLFSLRRIACSFPQKWISRHTCVNLISSHLSGRGKTFRTTAEINQRVGAWCSLCGLGQRRSHWKQPLALMMCSDPVEACKSAAGVPSFCSFNSSPKPPRSSSELSGSPRVMFECRPGVREAEQWLLRRKLAQL